MNDFGHIAIGARMTRFDPGFQTSWMRMISTGIREGDGLLSPAIGLPHAVAANVLVGEFLKSGLDSLLMVDDDMIIPGDGLELLRQTPVDCAMVSGLYCTRHAQYTPILLRRDTTGKMFPIPAPVPVTGTVEVNYCGMGFLLIKGATIRAVMQAKKTQEIFSFDPIKGEDGQFSSDVEAVGGKIVVNCDVILDHRIDAYTTLDKATGDPRISIVDFGIGYKTQIRSKER